MAGVNRSLHILHGKTIFPKGGAPINHSMLNFPHESATTLIFEIKIIELLKSNSEFSTSGSTPRAANLAKKILAKNIIGLINAADNCLNLDYEEEDELFSLEPQESELFECFEPFECGSNEFFELDYKQKVVDAKKKGASFKSIKHNWPRVK